MSQHDAPAPENKDGPPSAPDSPLMRFLFLFAWGGCIAGALIIVIGIMGAIAGHTGTISQMLSAIIGVLAKSWGIIATAFSVSLAWVKSHDYSFTVFFGIQVISLIIHGAACITCREYGYWKNKSGQEYAKRYRAISHTSFIIAACMAASILMIFPIGSLHIYAKLMYLFSIFSIWGYAIVYALFEKEIKGQER